MESAILLLLFSGEGGFVVVRAGGEQMVEDAGQFVSRGGDGLRASEACAHGSIKVAEMGSAAGQSLSCNPESVIEAVVGSRVFEDRILPPLFLLLGHKASQLANAAAEGKRLRSVPTSDSRV